MNFNEDHRLTPEKMAQVTGGAGCICYRNPFKMNGECICYKSNFGLCSDVNGGGGNEDREEPGVPEYPGK